MDDATAFGVVLDEAMTAAGVPVKELARKTDIAPSTIYAYLKGTRPAPARSKIDRLANELRVASEVRARLYAAAGIDVSADLADVAADVVRALPTELDKVLAVELLRAQARVVTQNLGRIRRREGAKRDEATIKLLPPPPGGRKGGRK